MVTLLSILNLDLNLLLLNILFVSYKITNNYYFINIFFLTLTISFILYYLDNFSLSDIKVIKYIQIFSFVGMPLFIISYVLFMYDNIIFTSIICNVGDVNNNVGTHINTNVNVNVNDEKSGNSMAVSVATGLTALGIGKAVAKMPMTPLQKVGAVVGASLAVGAGQATINYFSGGVTNTSNVTSDSNISKFIGNSQLSSLQGVF
jgi:hypothetical protein